MSATNHDQRISRNSWTRCEATDCALGYELMKDETRVWIRCAVCKKTIITWIRDGGTVRFPDKPHCSVESIVANLSSGIETVRATAFAVYYIDLRSRRMRIDLGGELIDNPREDELRLVADDAMILADDAAKKYAERLAKRAKKEIR